MLERKEGEGCMGLFMSFVIDDPYIKRFKGRKKNGNLGLIKYFPFKAQPVAYNLLLFPLLVLIVIRWHA